MHITYPKIQRNAGRIRLGLALVLLALPALSNGRSAANQSTPYTVPRWMAKMLALQTSTSNSGSSGIQVGTKVSQRMRRYSPPPSPQRNEVAPASL